MSYPSLAFGSAIFPENKEDTRQIFDVLEARKVPEIDTARIYAGSEETIGAFGAASKFSITTKAAGWSAGTHKKSAVLESANTSLRVLGVDKVRTYLLHSPDTTVPIAETLEAIQELYLAGKFERFGVSNFTAAQVQELYDTAKVKGYVLPSVYQANYNLVARTNEKALFPTLRGLGMSIQAYSPIAGGFLVKSPESITNPEKGGRWDPSDATGALYQKIYNKPELLDYLGKFRTLAQEVGTSQAGLAYRWVRYHSELQGGDTLIVGSIKPKQLEATLEELDKGPLEKWVVDRLEEMYKGIEGVAPADNYVGMFSA